MNKNIFKTIILSSAFVCGFTSCDLDQYPYDSIVTETAWQTIDDAERFRTGIYSYLRSISGGKYMYISDLQSDLFNATISYSNNGGDMHRWDFTAAQYDIEDTWRGCYETINNCNNIIQNIGTITLESDEEKAEANNIKGEALFIRALCYHNLAIRFAKDYDPSTASSNLGLPLVLEMDPMGKPSRSNLDETYKQIKSDINEARTLMSVQGEANSTYLTLDALNLFEARVDLYMHDYQNAITLAKEVMAKYPLIDNKDNLSSMWLNDESSEIIFRSYQSVDERANSMDMYLSYSTASEAFSPYYVPSKWVYDLYEDGDIRKDVFFLKSKITCLDQSVEDVYMLNKFPGNPALKKTEYEYYNMAKLFRSAEAYLIAAEAAYMINDANAIQYLNTLRAKRGASALNVSGENLMNAIEEEWIREFVGEGMRIDQLKRWNKSMVRHDPQNTTILMSGNGFTDFSKDASDIRFVWEIPNNDLNANANLVGNWE